MTPTEVKTLLEQDRSAVLLDIREPYELMLSRLEGAVNIPLSQMDARWQEIPADRPVVVFCHHGIRSARLIARLQARGRHNLINLDGGIDAWSCQVDPSVPRY